MRPINTSDTLSPSATLYHSAFGFAQVEAVDGELVHLSWERPGAHLPRSVRFEHLRRVYTLCESSGFFHRAVQTPDSLKQVLHSRPGDAVVWLLSDLGEPQSLQDVMDWLVGRELFTAKTFVRWWATAQAPIKADSRLRWRGDQVELSNTPQGEFLQLAPGLVESNNEHEEQLAQYLEDQTTEDTDRTDEFLPTDTAELHLAKPIPIGEAKLPVSRFIYLGQALSKALAKAHAAQRICSPNSFNTMVHPNGDITFKASGDASPGNPSFPADLQAAARVLVEAFIGRALPSSTDPADVLPFLRHRMPDLPPSALAPLAPALQPAPEDRPSASRWHSLWRAVVEAEESRSNSYNANADLRCGYDSHIGRVKLLLSQTNQDALWVGARGNRRMFVLADGISIADAGSGDLASRISVQTTASLWEALQSRRYHPRKMLDGAFTRANRLVCDASIAHAGGSVAGRNPMGTTILAASCHGNRVHLSWLGDSRAYLLGDYGAALLTSDDNVSGERFQSWCDHVAANWNASGHALVRYIGHFDEEERSASLPAHHLDFILRPGERILLSTDGITDYVHPHESGLCQVLQTTGKEPLDQVCTSLIAHANRRGGGDNATAIIFEVKPSRT